ncbi:DUF2591 family protein [Morganella morganii]
MNKYRDKSDFEINKAVAEYINIKIGHKFIDFDQDGIFVQNYDNISSPYSDGEPERIEFDPCNNPADAMPIIIENKIDLTHLVGDMVCAKHKEYWCIRKNPYRAGCEVYLLMKDAENEKS